MKLKTILLLALGILVFPLASAQGYNCPMGGMGYAFSGSYGHGMMIFSWAAGALILIIFVLLIIWLVKQLNKK